jgi:glutathione S-transferase
MNHAVAATLYSFRRCPYAMRARLALHVAGVAVEIREVALRDKPPSLRAISAKATVPVLQLPDGRVIDESLDILLWALHQNDPLRWLACEHDAGARQWVVRNDVDFKPLLDHYKYASRHRALTQQQHRELAVQRCIGPLDARLFPFVRQFARVEPDWFAADAPLPALRRWLAFWLGSSWFAAIMVKHRPWVDPAA